jgi:plastocyanin
MGARWTKRLVVAGAAVALLGTACSSSNDSSTGGSTGTSSGGTVSSTPGGAPTSSGKFSGTVSQANYSFTPSTFSVKSGDTITVKNTTPSTAHTFTVTGQNIDVTLQGGDSQKVKVDLPAGTYPFICSFHQSLGMTGTLTVT